MKKHWQFCVVGLVFLLILGTGALAAPFTRCGVFLGQTVCWFANDPPSGTAIEGAPYAGQVKVWYKYPGHANPIRIFVSNGRQVHYFDMNQPSSGMALAMDLAQGDTVTIGACDIYYGGNPSSFTQCQYRSMGWQEPVAIWACQASPNPYNRGIFDFTDLEAAVEAQGLPILSRQCWGDYQEDSTDLDFNDFVLILSYERTFTGYHDGRSGVISDPAECRALGWVRYDQNLSRDLRYRVLVDGVEQVSGMANLYRADLSAVCTGGTCAFSVNLWSAIAPDIPHTVLVQAQNFMTGEWFSLSRSPKVLTCLSPATSSPTVSPTPSVTPTSPDPPTPTPTVSPTPSATPIPPGQITASLNIDHSQLVYFGPKVGQPAQALTGEVRGGSSPYEVRLYVRSPSGLLTSYLLTSLGGFRLDAEGASNLYFGTQEIGTWTAWAVAVDADGETGASSSVIWEVSWWPVHGRP
jgi:hypothetical protein